VLSVKDDRMLQYPVPELQLLRGKRHTLENLTVTPESKRLIPGATGNALEIVAEFEPMGATRFGARLCVCNATEQFMRVYYDTASGDFGIDGNPQPWSAPGQGSGPSYLNRGEPVKMHIFLDKSIMEVFVNGHALSQRLFPNPKSVGLDLFAEGGQVRVESIDVWQMKSIW
jgi:sucrose-6-phosphate hydrolase SacC (GH32 family)